MRNKIYQGSSKILYQTDKEYSLIMSFTDDIKLQNGKTFNASGKGVINNTISSYIMSKLDMVGIENHLIEKINMREQIVQFVDIIPISISVSTLACGRYIKEFDMEEGYVFDQPMIDFRIKNAELKYPVINEYQIINFGWVSIEEIKILKKKAIRIADFLTGLFAGIGIRMVECNLEFGRVFNGEEFIIMIADEISPDNCKLWDLNNNEKLGFEAIECAIEQDSQQDLDQAILSYQNILKRFNVSLY